MADMIVKCQRSLETSEFVPQLLFYNRARDWLVQCDIEFVPQLLFYNRARDWLVQCDITDEWNKHFGPTTSPDDNRFFAEVKWPQRHEPPVFVRRLPEQGW